MNAIIGHCPRCGAPIYCQSPWFGIMPPPPIYSCSCVPHPQTVAQGNTFYYYGPYTEFPSPTEQSPEQIQNDFDDLTETLRAEGISKEGNINLEKVLDRLTHLENVVENLMKEIQKLTTKKPCNGDCKTKEPILKD